MDSTSNRDISAHLKLLKLRAHTHLKLLKLFKLLPFSSGWFLCRISKKLKKVYFMAHPSDGTLSIHFPYTTHAEKGGVKRPNLAVLTER